MRCRRNNNGPLGAKRLDRLFRDAAQLDSLWSLDTSGLQVSRCPISTKRGRPRGASAAVGGGA